MQLAGYISRLYISDDILWYLFTGDELKYPQVVGTLKESLTTALKNVAANDDYKMRYDLLNRYSNNYPFISAIYAVVGLIIAATKTASSFPDHLAATLLSTNVIFACTVMISLALCVKKTLSFSLGIGFCIALCYATLLSSFAASAFAPFYNATLHDGIQRALQHLIVPGGEFSAFSTGPRNMLTGLTMAVFMLRWSGRIRYSYWLLFALMTLHQSTTLLVLLFVVGIDVLLRPERIVSSSAPIGGAILFVGLRESVWHMAGLSQIALVTLSATIIAALLVITIRATSDKLKLPHRLVTVRRSLAEAPPTMIEPIAFVIVWILTLPIPYFVNQHVSLYQSYYFWSVLHTRALGVLHPSLLMGLIASTAVLVCRLNGRILIATVAALCVGFTLILTIARELPSLRSPYSALSANASSLDAELSDLSQLNFETLMNGPLVYFGMIKSAEGYDDRFARLLKAAPAPAP